MLLFSTSSNVFSLLQYNLEILPVLFLPNFHVILGFLLRFHFHFFLTVLFLTTFHNDNCSAINFELLFPRHTHIVSTVYNSNYVGNKKFRKNLLEWVVFTKMLQNIWELSDKLGCLITNGIYFLSNFGCI